MKYKQKLVAFAVAGIIGTSILGTGLASASGFRGGFMNQTPDEMASSLQKRFESEANLLGISVADIKEAWANGVSLQKLAEQKGISKETLQAKMKELRKTEMKTFLSSLVSKGVITQAQADKKLALIESGKGFMNGHKGMKKAEK